MPLANKRIQEKYHFLVVTTEKYLINFFFHKIDENSQIIDKVSPLTAIKVIYKTQFANGMSWIAWRAIWFQFCLQRYILDKFITKEADVRSLLLSFLLLRSYEFVSWLCWIIYWSTIFMYYQFYTLTSKMKCFITLGLIIKHTFKVPSLKYLKWNNQKTYPFRILSIFCWPNFREKDIFSCLNLDTNYIFSSIIKLTRPTSNL